MDHFTAAEPPRSDSLPARDAPPAFDRFEILRCARDIGRRGGWTAGRLSYFELLLSYTREDDWGPDRQPAVWLSVRATAEKLGVSPRTVHNHEKVLEDMGMLVVRTQGDGRRRGERGEDGRIAWAWGVYLSPARERLPELRAAAAAARRENVDLRTAHAAARDLHGQIRGMLADRGDGGALDEMRAELMDMRRRFRRAGAIESVREWISGLLRLRGRLRELLAGIPEAADGESEAAPDPVEAGIPEGGVNRNFRRAQPEIQAQTAEISDVDRLLTDSKKDSLSNGSPGRGPSRDRRGEPRRTKAPKGSGRAAGAEDANLFAYASRNASRADRPEGREGGGGERPPAPVRLPNMNMIQAGAGKIPWNAVQELADAVKRRNYWLGNPGTGEAGLVDAARSQMLRLGVSWRTWGAACEVMGRRGAAAAAVLVLLKWDAGVVFSPARYFDELVDLARRGRLRLARSVYGWLIEMRPDFPAAAKFSRAGGATDPLTPEEI